MPYINLKKALLLFALVVIAFPALADTSMIHTGDTVYTMRKKNRKTIISTSTTTTIYEKKSGKPGVIKKIITETKYVNDRKNKKSFTENKLIKTQKELKKNIHSKKHKKYKRKG